MVVVVVVRMMILMLVVMGGVMCRGGGCVDAMMVCRDDGRSCICCFRGYANL